MSREEIHNNFDSIFEKCMDDIVCRDRSVQDCLDAYPEHAGNLKPLLTTVAVSRKAAGISPREDFKSRARYEFSSAVAEMKEKPNKPWFNFSMGWVQVAVSAVVALMITGGGVIAASGSSLPGQPLYSVKVFTEQVQLGLTFSETARTQLYANLADRRVDEIITLAEAGNVEPVMETNERLSSGFAAMAGTYSGFPGTQQPPSLVDSLVDVASAPEGEKIRASVPESFIIEESDNETVTVLKHKAVAGYLAITQNIDDATGIMKAALEETLAVYVQGYENAIIMARE
ncbi:MAG: hypothetical protein JW954_07300 [Dehalococcoidaceae bacterium]|nr:hypothetical protein [Dehalococcoidaceae bacterium]